MDEPATHFTHRDGAAPEAGIVFRRSARARRYRLTLRADGTAVATIPTRGSEREARRFVEQHAGWLERARGRQSRRPRVVRTWTAGTQIPWRGDLTEIRVASTHPPAVCLASDVFRVPGLDGDLRASLEKQFFARARAELPVRAWELSHETGAGIRNVTVRNQRSRWGSCSATGTVSLNWRLIQMPDRVRDYVILHELVHFRDEMNHSDRFWARVEEVCPWWRDAERWIKHNSGMLAVR
jgi:predicted metal-dependent hydrolase